MRILAILAMITTSALAQGALPGNSDLDFLCRVRPAAFSNVDAHPVATAEIADIWLLPTSASVGLPYKLLATVLPTGAHLPQVAPGLYGVIGNTVTVIGTGNAIYPSQSLMPWFGEIFTCPVWPAWLQGYTVHFQILSWATSPAGAPFSTSHVLACATVPDD